MQEYRDWKFARDVITHPTFGIMWETSKVRKLQKFLFMKYLGSDSQIYSTKVS